MHSNSDNTEIIIYNKAYRVIKELFKLILNRNKTGLEKSMKVVILFLTMFIYFVKNDTK